MCEARRRARSALHQLAEQVQLDIADDAVADAIDQGGLEDLGKAPPQRQGDDDQGDGAQRFALGVDDQVVHRRLQDAQQQPRQGREHRRAQEGEGKALPSRRQIGPGHPSDDVPSFQFGVRAAGRHDAGEVERETRGVKRALSHKAIRLAPTSS